MGAPTELGSASMAEFGITGTGSGSRRPEGLRPQLRLTVAEDPETALALDPPTLEFVRDLVAEFEARRQEVLRSRGGFRALVEAGRTPSFPEETARQRADDWTVSPPARDLVDRRVEITGPVDRKTILNALNSGARVFMADFEDAHAPTWSGTIEGQLRLSDAIRRRIDFVSSEGKDYRLRATVATLMMRPRGWHLEERHLEADGRPISASLFDFGVYFARNARELVARGTAPYVYLPKMEHYLEARLWNDVFEAAERWAGLPRGTVRATALIETLPAAFQMDEILFELREHSAGLNCGRWDYLFSFLKQFRGVDRIRFPDREQLVMSTPFLTAYSHLLIRTCHRRGAHAMGGMAAQIPIRDDPEANAAALAKVVADKEREVRAGHDGTWVAHPALVPIAQAVFDREMTAPNQIDRPGPPGPIGAAELLAVPAGPVTESGVRHNARVAVRYLDAWLRGVGCVPIDHLMEDAATVEIARSELWTWVHRPTRLPDGTPLTPTRVATVLEEEAAQMLADLHGGRPDAQSRHAVRLLREVVESDDLEEFITRRAYPYLEELAPGAR